MSEWGLTDREAAIQLVESMDRLREQVGDLACYERGEPEFASQDIGRQVARIKEAVTTLTAASP